MSGDWGRIHYAINDHQKFQKASLPAIGLWTLGNAFTRQKRSRGHLTHEEALTLSRGEEHLIEELCDVAELWDRVGDGYDYHDYAEHNAGDQPRTAAARMVTDVLGERYPQAVRNRLTGAVAELLEEGQEDATLRAALKLWSDKPDAGIGLLPFLVAEAIRQKQDGDLTAIIRKCWVSGDVTPLRRFGHWFTEPDPPNTIKTAAQMSKYMLAQKRAWLETLAKETS